MCVYTANDIAEPRVDVWRRLFEVVDGLRSFQNLIRRWQFYFGLTSKEAAFKQAMDLSKTQRMKDIRNKIAWRSRQQRTGGKQELRKARC
jgi:hypothetical protein